MPGPVEKLELPLGRLEPLLEQVEPNEIDADVVVEQELGVALDV